MAGKFPVHRFQQSNLFHPKSPVSISQVTKYRATSHPATDDRCGSRRFNWTPYPMSILHCSKGENYWTGNRSRLDEGGFPGLCDIFLCSDEQCRMRILGRKQLHHFTGRPSNPCLIFMDPAIYNLIRQLKLLNIDLWPSNKYCRRRVWKEFHHHSGFCSGHIS